MCCADAGDLELLCLESERQVMVLLFSLDGVRPDAIEQAETPTLDRLKRQGAWTGRARTEMPSVTLPCHQSMLRGVPVTRHRITSNQFQPLARPVPTLFY